MENLLSLMSDHAILPTSWMWVIFGAIVLLLLYLDLFIFHKNCDEPNFKSTINLCIFYVVIAIIFGLFVIYERGTEQGMLFFTGFMVEKSLSLDNIFVISVVFSSLGVPRKYQHRVLFWGILGALVMRAILILVGETLVSNFHWVLYVFSAFLIYTGIKMVLDSHDENPDFENSKLYKLINKYFHVTSKIDGEHFFVKRNGKHYITPLFFALIIIETMDVIFALDSIPAIFLITQDVFIVYTSNIFAILGLRALYFLLAEAVHRFAYLKYALSIILIFIGSKIFLPYIGLKVSSSMSLVVTFGLILLGIIVSLIKTKKEAQKA